MAFYVSWNGATEVRYWNFYASDSATGPWELIGTKDRTGFETDFILTGWMGWAFAEALDANCKPLKRGRSSIVKTFVPSDLIVSGCNDSGCNDIVPLREGETFNKTMPEVGDRGDNYTKDLGVNTISYYPVSKYTFREWPLSILTIPAALILLLAVGLSFTLGKRRLAGFGAVGQDYLLSPILSFIGSRTGGSKGSDTEYHKLETTDST